MPKGLCILGIFVLWYSTTTAQATFEKGHIPVNNYIAGKHFQGLAQNWVIAQDSLGLIYVGNNQNLLQYDGEQWRAIEVNNSSTVRGLLNHQGKIYVGTLNDFGVIDYDPKGLAYYKSLKSFTQDIGQVWNVFSIKNEVIFRTSQSLYYYSPKTKQIQKLPLPIARDAAYQVGDRIFCADRDDEVIKIEDKKAQIIPFPKGTFRYKYVKSVVSKNTDEYLFISAYSPFYIVKKNDFESKPIDLFANKISSALYFEHSLIHNNKILLGTKNAGLIQLNQKLDIEHFYNTANQLQDNYVHYTFVDAQGNVWLALNNGISAVKIQADLSFLDQSYGFEGIIESISRFKGNVSLATHSGFYTMHKQNSQRLQKVEDIRPHFKQIKEPNVTTQCWVLQNLHIEGQEHLLGISNNGVHDISQSQNPKLLKTCEAYSLAQSTQDPKRMFVGLNDGVFSLYYTQGTWREEGYVTKTDFIVNSILEKNNKLWLGAQADGACVLYDLHLKKQALFNLKQGLPGDDIHIYTFKNDLIFGTKQGLYRYNPIDSNFYKDPVFNYFLPDTASYIHKISVDPKGRLWLITYDHVHKKVELGFFKEYQGRIIWVSEPFNEIEQGDVHAIFHDPDGITWLGGQNGLFRFDEKELTRYRAPFNTQIRKIVLNGDSTLFWGHFTDASGRATLVQPKSSIPKLAYDYNSPTFYFAAQDYENNDSKLYSYFLEGYSQRWSAYSRENKAVFTNLSEGTYTFKVKTKNRYDQLSESRGYTFTVLPPWYRTWWAYALFLLAGTATVFTVVYYYTKNLRNIIEARTAEIRAQKEIIEAKNHDILSSIDYAQKIQQALLPSNEVLRNIFSDSFVVFFPRDVVSGDFYWVGKKHENISFALMDCTGHGVPGAFMSMIGNALLNELILEKGITMPSLVLDSMKKNIIQSLSQHNDEHRRDGMDAALCTIEPKTLLMHYAGGNMPLYIYRKQAEPLKNQTGEVIEPILQEGLYFVYELKPDKMPVGYFDEHARYFSNHTLQMMATDRVYLFTDGFPDQFGGEKEKKYKRTRLLSFLLSIQRLSLVDQRQTIAQEFNAWKGNIEQIDDVSVLAVEI